jgi:hypothetical protein
LLKLCAVMYRLLRLCGVMYRLLKFCRLTFRYTPLSELAVPHVCLQITQISATVREMPDVNYRNKLQVEKGYTRTDAEKLIFQLFFT